MQIETHLTLAADHPAYAGHFPAQPIVPGVLLLDAVLQAIFAASGLAATAWQISAVKFLSPLLPGEAVVIAHEQLEHAVVKGVVKFEVLAMDRKVDRKIVSGSLLLVDSIS